MISELFHVGSLSVLDTTHFAIALMWSEYGSPDMAVHTGTNAS
jgi:hypothetical protein